MAGFLAEVVGLPVGWRQREWLEVGLLLAVDFLFAEVAAVAAVYDFPEAEVPLVVLKAGPQVGEGLLPPQAVGHRRWGLVLWAEKVGLTTAPYVNRWWQFFWSS